MVATRRIAQSLTRTAWVRARFGVAARAVMLLFQLLAVTLALQVSSFAHVAADVLEHLDDAADCDHERSGDDGDDECPPGCPTCHSCAHAQAFYVPRATCLLRAPISNVQPRVLNVDDMPPPLALPSVFRPPRAHRFAPS